MREREKANLIRPGDAAAGSGSWDEIGRSLEAIADTLRASPRLERWNLVLGGTKIVAQLADGWLCFDSTSITPRPSDWEQLAANRTFAGGVKLVRGGREDALRVRAEIPLEPARDLAPELRAIRAGWLEASAGTPLAGESEQLGAGGGSEASGLEDLSAELPVLCEQIGRPYSIRSDGHAVIDLATDTDFWQAEVHCADDGSLRLRVPVQTAGAYASEVASLAQSLLLLRAGGALRLVRPTAEREHAGEWAAAFEVHLVAGAEAATGARFCDALGALAAACMYAGSEARLVASCDDVARAFLAAAPGPGSQPQTAQARKLRETRQTRNQEPPAPQVAAAGFSV